MTVRSTTRSQSSALKAAPAPVPVRSALTRQGLFSERRLPRSGLEKASSVHQQATKAYCVLTHQELRILRSHYVARWGA
eukprot:6199716-Pleurochrysis_carterae.AAC.2